MVLPMEIEATITTQRCYWALAPSLKQLLSHFLFDLLHIWDGIMRVHLSMMQLGRLRMILYGRNNLHGRYDTPFADIITGVFGAL